MVTLDRRTKRDATCFGCGRVVDGTALEVWATTSGPILALLCPVCQEDVTVREALAGHLIAHMDPARSHISWETGDRALPLGFEPATKEAILERLIAGDSFSFGA